MTALDLITAERLRQQTEEGYTPEHDDEHTEGQLALLTAAYVCSSRPPYAPVHGLLETIKEALDLYGWEDSFEPKDPIRDLVRAGALILAELERRLRAEDKPNFLGGPEESMTPPSQHPFGRRSL